MFSGCMIRVSTRLWRERSTSYISSARISKYTACRCKALELILYPITCFFFCIEPHVPFTGMANVCELIWHRVLTQRLTTENADHVSHQWHIKTITDSVWRKILQGNTQPSSLCAFKSSSVFTEACTPSWLPLPAPGTTSGYPLAGREHTVQHSGCRWATSPSRQPLTNPDRQHLIRLPFFNVRRVHRLLCGDTVLGESH